MMTYCQLGLCADKTVLDLILTIVKKKCNNIYQSFNLHLKLFTTSLQHWDEGQVHHCKGLCNNQTAQNNHNNQTTLLLVPKFAAIKFSL